MTIDEEAGGRAALSAPGTEHAPQSHQLTERYRTALAGVGSHNPIPAPA